jgi:phosphoribosyl 1,2-cyclic phosphodiesterase
VFIKCWGTRGTLPRPLDDVRLIACFEQIIDEAQAAGVADLEALRSFIVQRDAKAPLTHGGHTMCTQVGHGDATLFVDAGSGLQPAGLAALESGRTEHHLLLTHLHADHTLGLPLFAPLLRPGHRVHIHYVHAETPDVVRDHFDGVRFPLTWDELAADVLFHPRTVYEPFDLDGLRVTAFHLDHPGGCHGYRIDAADHAVAIGVDGEYQRLSVDELGDDAPYYRGLDALLFDGPYNIAEWGQRLGWGHGTPARGVELAVRERIGTLLIAHHDPTADEARLGQLLAEAERYRDDLTADTDEGWKPVVQMAYDGLRWEV